MTNELLTTDQLVLELGVKTQTLRLWRTKTRKGKPIGPKWTTIRKPNNHSKFIRYLRSDIEEWQSTFITTENNA